MFIFIIINTMTITMVGTFRLSAINCRYPKMISRMERQSLVFEGFFTNLSVCGMYRNQIFSILVHMFFKDCLPLALLGSFCACLQDFDRAARAAISPGNSAWLHVVKGSAW